MGEITVRLAGPQDAEALVKWTVSNNQIDPEDIKSSTKEVNPTSTVLVFEQDGKVLLYTPFYCAMTLALLAFNPSIGAKERVAVLNKAQKALEAFGLMHGVTELITYSKEGYGVANWAVKHGFEVEPRQAFKMRLGKE